nr:reverse transcriptase domain-containing protein [Tanacetum cinerariifolium]
MKKVVKKEIIRLLDAGIIYAIEDSHWVSPVHCVPKKGGMTIVTNEDNELVPTRIFTGWRVCIDYRKLNKATQKDYFPPSFMDQMLERLAGNMFFCFLDRFFRYFQIPIERADQEKTTFTFPYGTYAYKRMPFGLCNAPTTFQRLWFELCRVWNSHMPEVLTHRAHATTYIVFFGKFKIRIATSQGPVSAMFDFKWQISRFSIQNSVQSGAD